MLKRDKTICKWTKLQHVVKFLKKKVSNLQRLIILLSIEIYQIIFYLDIGPNVLYNLPLEFN